MRAASKVTFNKPYKECMSQTQEYYKSIVQMLHRLLWPKGYDDYFNLFPSRLLSAKIWFPSYVPDIVYTQMLSCTIWETDFSTPQNMYMHNEQASRGLEVVTLFYYIFFPPFMQLLWTLRKQTCHSWTPQLTTQLQIPSATQTLTGDLSRWASRYSGIMFPLCTKVPGFVAPTPLSLLLRSAVCGWHAKEKSRMLKGRTACERNLFVFATDEAKRAGFCYLTWH